MEYYNFLVISLCALFYTLILQAKELQMLQQNSYRNTRYLKWLKKNALTFSRICDTVLLALLFIFKNYPVIFYLAAIYFLKSTLLEGAIQKILSVFDLSSHFDDFTNGILDVSNVVYYLTVIGLFLFFTVQSIQKRRWS